MLKEWQEELKRQEEQHKLNYPYGDLDYQNVPGNVNLYWAPLPESQTVKRVDNVFDGIYTVYDTLGVRTKIPTMSRDVELLYFVPKDNTVVARETVGREKTKVAWQEWEKRYINGEPVFRTRNWIADGPDDQPKYQYLLIDLTTEEVVNVDYCPEYVQLSNLSENGLLLLTTFLSHRASGDEIIKGLNALAKRRGIDTFNQFKITSCHLGGWLISGNLGSNITISDFIEYVERAFAH
jgi:hypothetical protein